MQLLINYAIIKRMINLILIIKLLLFQQRMSFSKFNVNCLGDPLYSPSPKPPHRLRQNSVFAGSSTMTFMSPPRRAKSAMDIQHLVQGESNSKLLYGYRSMQPIRSDTSPIKENQIKDRKPSITIERASTISSNVPRRKPSMCHEFSSYFPLPRHRPTSCYSDYRQTAYGRSKFKSFDQPSCSWERNPKLIDRRLSTAFERSAITKSRTRPSISLERPSMSWDRRPSVTIEPPPANNESDEHDEHDEQTEDETTACLKRVLKKQTTINMEDTVPHIKSFSLDQATASTSSSIMSYDRRPSFTIEHPSSSSNDTGVDMSSVIGCQRLSVSLDQATLGWQGTAPTFTIEGATPLTPQPPSIGSPPAEIRFLEAETESLQVTNV